MSSVKAKRLNVALRGAGAMEWKRGEGECGCSSGVLLKKKEKSSRRSCCLRPTKLYYEQVELLL